MKKITSLFLVLITVSACQKMPECNCTDFKTGTFEFVQTINGKQDTTRFVRTADEQIETYQGRTDTANVRWVNDCELIIQKKNPRNREEKKAISMKIVETKDNQYIMEYSFVGDVNKQLGTVTKRDWFAYNWLKT